MSKMPALMEQESILAHEGLEVYQESLAFVSWLSAVLQEEALHVDEFKERLDRVTVLKIAEATGASSAEESRRLFGAAHRAALGCAAFLDILVAESKLTSARIQPGKEYLQKTVGMLVELSDPSKGQAANGADLEISDRLLSELLTDGVEDEENQAGTARTAAPAAPEPAPKPKKVSEEEPKEATPVRNWVILGVCVLILAVTWFWSGGAPSPAVLGDKALAAADGKDRQLALAELSMNKGPAALPELRRVAEETQDSEVLLSAINMLATRQDYYSLPLFFKAMQHEKQAVREAGYKGFRNLIPVNQNVEFRADDPADRRSEAVRQLRELSEKSTLKPGESLLPPRE